MQGRITYYQTASGHNRFKVVQKIQPKNLESTINNDNIINTLEVQVYKQAKNILFPGKPQDISKYTWLKNYILFSDLQNDNNEIVSNLMNDLEDEPIYIKKKVPDKILNLIKSKENRELYSKQQELIQDVYDNKLNLFKSFQLANLDLLSLEFLIMYWQEFEEEEYNKQRTTFIKKWKNNKLYNNINEMYKKTQRLNENELIDFYNVLNNIFKFLKEPVDNQFEYLQNKGFLKKYGTDKTINIPKAKLFDKRTIDHVFKNNYSILKKGETKIKKAEEKKNKKTKNSRKR